MSMVHSTPSDEKRRLERRANQATSVTNSAVNTLDTSKKVNLDPPAHCSTSPTIMSSPATRLSAIKMFAFLRCTRKKRLPDVASCVDTACSIFIPSIQHRSSRSAHFLSIQTSRVSSTRLSGGTAQKVCRGGYGVALVVAVAITVGEEVGEGSGVHAGSVWVGMGVVVGAIGLDCAPNCGQVASVSLMPKVA